MAVDLIYKHQQKTYELMKESLKKNKKAAYVFPVGCGKSFPVLKYIEDNPDKKVLFVSPNLAIINQMKKYISTYILNGKEVNKKTMPNFRAVTYQSLQMLGNRNIKPDVIVFDEIHRMGAEKWEQDIDKLLEANPDAEIIGMSATPERTDKRNMAYEKFGDSVVYEMSLTEALSGEKEGEVVLNGARYVRVISELKEYANNIKKDIDLIEDEKRKGKLIEKYEKLSSIISNAPGIQDVMAQAMKKKNGKYIVFCSNREEMFEKMRQAQEIFGKVNKNIRADYVITNNDGIGKTTAENRKTIEEFESRENGDALNLLFCVDMLNEGRHIEGIDGEVQFRPTDSSILYKQQIGRVLSSDKNAEETVIIDSVNNWLRQLDTFMELGHAIEKTGNKSSYKLFNFTSEELELLDILREIGEELGYNKFTFSEIVEWLESHDGKMPRVNIRKDGKRYSVEEMTEEENVEVNLYARWRKSPERLALNACIGIPLDELPEKYVKFREQIKILREYGLGLSKPTPYEEIIEWLDTHDGQMPSSSITVNGRTLTVEEMTDDQIYQKNLYARWGRTKEKRALDACVGIPLDSLPEEYVKYRDQIEILRGYGLGLRKPTPYEEIIEWLDSHDGQMPRGSLGKKNKKVSELTEEERFEKNLYQRWGNAPEKKALEACKRNIA